MPESDLTQETYIADVRKALNDAISPDKELEKVSEKYRGIPGLSLNVRFVNPITSKLPPLVSATDAPNMRNTPMAIAVSLNDPEVIKQLGRMHASLTYPDGCGYTPLNTAAGTGAAKSAKFLLEDPTVLAGINEPSTDKVATSPLMHSVIVLKFNPVTKILLAHNAKFSDEDVKRFAQIVETIKTDSSISDIEKDKYDDIVKDLTALRTKLADDTSLAIAKTEPIVKKALPVEQPITVPLQLLPSDPIVRKATHVDVEVAEHKPASFPHKYSRYHQDVSGESTGKLLAAIADKLHAPVTGNKLTTHNIDLIEQAGFKLGKDSKGHKVLDVAKLETYIANAKTKPYNNSATVTYVDHAGKEAEKLMHTSIFDLPTAPYREPKIKHVADDNIKAPNLFSSNAKPVKHL